MGAWKYEIHLLVFRLYIDLTGKRSERVEHQKINLISSRPMNYFSI